MMNPNHSNFSLLQDDIRKNAKEVIKIIDTKYFLPYLKKKQILAEQKKKVANEKKGLKLQKKVLKGKVQSLEARVEELKEVIESKIPNYLEIYLNRTNGVLAEEDVPLVEVPR